MWCLKQQPTPCWIVLVMWAATFVVAIVALLTRFTDIDALLSVLEEAWQQHH